MKRLILGAFVYFAIIFLVMYVIFGFKNIVELVLTGIFSTVLFVLFLIYKEKTPGR